MRNYEELIIDICTGDLTPKEKERLIQFLHGQREFKAQDYHKYKAALEAIDNIRPRRA